MKQLLDYIPLLVFFTVWSLDERTIPLGDFSYTLGGIFSAAEFLLLSSLLVYGGLYLYQRKLDKFQLITLCVVILFCIPTIILRDTSFLKWKATIANWLFASIFLGSRFVSPMPAIEHMMGHAVKAPREVWLKLNNIWVVYFVVLGAVNLAVAFLMSESVWINFKVWGNLIITFAFIFGQMPYLSRYLTEPDSDVSDQKP